MEKKNQIHRAISCPKMASSNSKPHIVIFPFMAQGHAIPLLDLSMALSRRGLKVTIITTPSNAHTITQYVSTHSDIHLRQVPFPKVHGLPEGRENLPQTFSRDQLFLFLKATKLLRDPFEATLRYMCQLHQTGPFALFLTHFWAGPMPCATIWAFLRWF